uniref:Uncharacterized protein n=1 Tax=Steinernema glaseri TaxID=37863 RepID=A0A1I8APM1_9BILA
MMPRGAFKVHIHNSKDLYLCALRIHLHKFSNLRVDLLRSIKLGNLEFGRGDRQMSWRGMVSEDKNRNHSKPQSIDDDRRTGTLTACNHVLQPRKNRFPKFTMMLVDRTPLPP